MEYLESWRDQQILRHTAIEFSGRGTTILCLISTRNSWELNPIAAQCSSSLTHSNSRLKTCCVAIADGGEQTRCGLAYSCLSAALLSSSCFLSVLVHRCMSQQKNLRNNAQNSNLGWRWQPMSGCFSNTVSPLPQEFNVLYAFLLQMWQRISSKKKKKIKKDKGHAAGHRNTVTSSSKKL